MPPIQWHQEPQTGYWHQLYIGTAKCYHWLASKILPAGYDRQDHELTTTVGSRGQLHVYVCAYTSSSFTSHCVHTICFKILSSNFTSHCIHPEHTIVQGMELYLKLAISSQDGRVQQGCDCTVSYTKKKFYLFHSMWLL